MALYSPQDEATVQFWIRTCIKRAFAGKAGKADLIAGFIAPLLTILAAVWIPWQGTLYWIAVSLPFALLLLLIAFGLLSAAYTSYREVVLGRNRLRDRITGIEEAAPNVVYDSWDIEPDIPLSRGAVFVGRADFVHVMFKNDPKVRVEAATAKKVIARITFLNAEGSRIFDMIGRWTETPEPSQVGRLLVERYNEMDLPPNARPVKLDLVMKFRDEPDCYGQNNESAQFPQMKNPSRKLSLEVYRVKVHLTGIGVDKTFSFLLRNYGTGEPPRIELQEG